MAHVQFTQHLARYVDCQSAHCQGRTVQEALASIFIDRPQLKDYVLDNQNQLRKHVTIFIDGALIKDRITLGDPITENSEIFILQALSGG